MKVKEICTLRPASGTTDSNLAAIGWMMWAHDCGVIPIADAGGKPVGVVTDRDLALAAATMFRPAAEIHVREVMSARVVTCPLEADIHEALAIMQAEKVHRLVVVDGEGRLRGVLSLTDIARAAESGLGDEECAITRRDVVKTLKALSERHPIAGPPKEPLELVEGC
jgi:CBS domain-containing protein